jgi:hypothetical protein
MIAGIKAIGDGLRDTPCIGPADDYCVMLRSRGSSSLTKRHLLVTGNEIVEAEASKVKAI